VVVGRDAGAGGADGAVGDPVFEAGWVAEAGRGGADFHTEDIAVRTRSMPRLMFPSPMDRRVSRSAGVTRAEITIRFWSGSIRRFAMEFTLAAKGSRSQEEAR
jgi:hypothetical protein